MISRRPRDRALDILSVPRYPASGMHPSEGWGALLIVMAPLAVLVIVLMLLVT